MPQYPNALRAPGLVGVVHRDRAHMSAYLWVPAGQIGGRRRLEECVPRGRGFWLRPATSISPRTTVTLVLLPATLQWSERAERASIQQINQTKYHQRNSL